MTLREHTTTAAGTEAHGPILTTRLAAEAQTVLRPMPSRPRPSRVKETNSTEGSAMAAIEIQGLSKRFGDITAVADLSFSTPAGAVTGFPGAHGAGKTPTPRVLLGPGTPTQGPAPGD